MMKDKLALSTPLAESAQDLLGAQARPVRRSCIGMVVGGDRITWMDEVRSRSSFDYMGPWHYANPFHQARPTRQSKKPKAMCFGHWTKW